MFDLTENSRLLKVREEYDESQTEFAHRLGLKQGSYSDVERGIKMVKGEKKYVPVSIQTKTILYESLGVRKLWFETGIEPIFKDGFHPKRNNQKQKINNEIQNNDTESIESLIEQIRILKDHNKTLSELSKMKDIVIELLQGKKEHN